MRLGLGTRGDRSAGSGGGHMHAASCHLPRCPGVPRATGARIGRWASRAGVRCVRGVRVGVGRAQEFGEQRKTGRHVRVRRWQAHAVGGTAGLARPSGKPPGRLMKRARKRGKRVAHAMGLVGSVWRMQWGWWGPDAQRARCPSSRTRARWKPSLCSVVARRRSSSRRSRRAGRGRGRGERGQPWRGQRHRPQGHSDQLTVESRNTCSDMVVTPRAVTAPARHHAR